jgi:hypothetical protein
VGLLQISSKTTLGFSGIHSLSERRGWLAALQTAGLAWS